MNSLKTKVANNGFVKFTMKHKKMTVFVVIALVLIIVIVILNIPKNVSYDFSLAYKSYKEKKDEEVSLSSTPDSEDASSPDDSHGYNGICYRVDAGDTVSYSLTATESGTFAIYLDTYILHNGFHDSEISLSVNDEVVIEKSKLRANWKSETTSFKKDSYGNEVVPSQVKVDSWTSLPLYDSSFSTPLPLEVTLKSGTNVLKVSYLSGLPIIIGSMEAKSSQNLLSYEDYSKVYSSAEDGEMLDYIEGEKYSYKNDTQPIPTYDSDVNATPYDTSSSCLNTVSNFSSATEIISYVISTPKTGNYTINLNGKVDNSNHTTFITLFLDGVVPFGEMLHYPLKYSSGLCSYILEDKSSKQYSFFLTKGEHTLSLKIDQSLLNEQTTMLGNSINSLNSIYLNLKRIAGTVSDSSREWNPDTDFPGVVDELKTIVSNLESAKKKLYEINGSNVDYTATIDIASAINSLNGILGKPQYIPNNYAQFSEGGSSILTSLSSAKEDLLTTPFMLDKILIGPASSRDLMNYKSGWFSFTEHIKKFFSSFFKDYSGTTSGDKTIQVWVARSRQYVDLMQQTIDESTFEKDTGYKVRFTLLADEGKLILSNAAGSSPNAVMGISNWLPYEMGIRGLTVDLTKFKDYGQVISRFSKGSLINLISDDKGLGLPETQDFYVTYYRKDIVNSYGYTLPSTWNDVISLLPKMQRNGMNFYIPLSSSTSSKSIMTTAPFIFQYGGNLFSDDGTRTTIDEENSINAIKLMTNLYTLYGMETQVSSFFDSFRNGSLPIGVSTFDTYVRLSIGAPEISGKWGITLSPGVEQADGSVSRYQTGSSTAMSLLPSGDEAKDNAGWELLKWWSSADVQREFASNLSLLYGKGYIWNSANIEAFNDSLIFTSDEKSVILKQWEYLREIPKVPGWYMLERELSNAWNDIVLNAKNTRSVISDAVTSVNKELTKKLTEFGYLDSSGKTLKTYHMTTFDTIEGYLNG